MLKKAERAAYQAEPGEDQIEQLIYHEYMNPELPHQAMRRAVDVVEVDGRVYGGEKGPVEPTTTLRDQLGNLG